MLRSKLGSPIFLALMCVLLATVLLGGCNRTPARQAAATPAPTPTPQPVVSEAGGFTFALPAGWSVRSTPDTPLGTELRLLPPADDAEAGGADAAAGRIYFSNVRTLDRNAALARLCSDCTPLPTLTETTLNGRPAWTGTLAINDAPARQWTFVDNGDVLVFFTLYDPLTQELLSSVIDSLRFTPVIDRAARTAEMAEAMRMAIAQQSAVDDAAVAVVAIEEVTWPDLCLGVPLGDEMCAAEETPGYRVTIDAPTGAYRFHFDPVTTQVRLAAAPEVNIGATLIEWRTTDSSCEQVRVGTTGVAFGACGSDVLLSGPIVDDARFALLQNLVAALAPFEAETPAGTVRFLGNGARSATPTEQRQLGELAQLLARQARGATEPEPLLSWQRTGGFAGFCDRLALYRTGEARASSCRADAVMDDAASSAVTSLLNLEELVQLYTWVDLLGDTAAELSDEPVKGEAIADAMTIRLTFGGDGLQTATDRDLAALLHFAATLFAEMGPNAAPAIGEAGLPEEFATACPAATAGARVHAIPELGFCLLAPAEFSAFRALPNEVIFAVDSPGNLSEPQLYITSEAAAGRTAADALRAGAAQTDAQDVLVAGQPALLFETAPRDTAVDPLDAARDRRVIFVDNETLYRFDFIAPQRAAGDIPATTVETLFESIVQSFTLVEQEGVLQQ